MKISNTLVPELKTLEILVKEKKKKGNKKRSCGLTINQQSGSLNNSNTRTKSLKKGNTMLQLANMLKGNHRIDSSNKLKQL